MKSAHQRCCQPNFDLLKGDNTVVLGCTKAKLKIINLAVVWSVVSGHQLLWSYRAPPWHRDTATAYIFYCQGVRHMVSCGLVQPVHDHLGNQSNVTWEISPAALGRSAEGQITQVRKQSQKSSSKVVFSPHLWERKNESFHYLCTSCQPQACFT